MAPTEPSTAAQPIDAVAERLNDPAVAASLVTLLDNAELLSTLVLGLSGLMERGDMIMDAVAEGVNDMKAASGSDQAFPPLGELSAVATQLTSSAPALTQLLDSSMTDPATISTLADLASAATTGAAAARTNKTTVDGVRGAYRALKDPDVQAGLGVLIEIAGAIGRPHRSQA